MQNFLVVATRYWSPGYSSVVVSGQSTTGLQGLQYNRPSASLILHSPSSYVRRCNSLSVTSKQRRRNLLNYACVIRSHLTNIPNEQDDQIVVTHPGSNNPWKWVICSGICPTNSAFLKFLLTVHQIRHIIYKCHWLY